MAAPLVDGEAAATDRLLPLLERAARFGRPCPTDRRLAELTTLTPEEVALTMIAMREARVIHVQSAPSPTLRRVTILSTGHRTGLARA